MKKIISNITLVLVLSLNAFDSFATTGPQCLDKSFTLQLLGSGGPISDDARASSGEVIWIDGKSRLMIDAGGGTYLRFGQAGARIEDLDAIAITHFHTDHSANLPAILKGAYFSDRKSPLPILGPDHGGLFPSMKNFTHREFDKKTGSFAYLHGLESGTEGLFKIEPLNIDYKSPISKQIFKNKDFTIYALGIPHGDVPCLAFKIVTNNGIIVISGDQNGSNKAFVDFAKGADILQMPLAIDENADKQSNFLHAKPSVIGKLASEIKPKILVLNHFMGKGLVLKDQDIAIVKKYYKGPVYAAKDLSCFPVNGIKNGELK